ncbi:MAG: hypothetical protein DCC49_06005 [Acidobacteria bacterium]|nr:MAG: hypothetical protein DCC49_06005 [Acidobacteriota bacterium]
MEPRFPQAEEVPDEAGRTALTDPQSGESIKAIWNREIEFCRLDLGGTYLSYIDAGAGRPIVLIPGWMGSAFNFAPQIEALASDFRVICFDPIGSGMSDRPSIAYSPAEHFRFARRFIEKLRVWPSVVVGHSMGGAIAYALASENPELVRGLAMIAPRPPVLAKEPVAQRLFRQTARRFPRASESLVASAIKSTSAQIAKSNVPKGLFENTGEIRDFLSSILKSRGFSRAAARTLIQLENWSEWSGRLREIEAPSLVIWGTKDKVNPMANTSEITAELPEAEVALIEGAGHLPTLEAPEAVNEAVVAFAKRILE